MSVIHIETDRWREALAARLSDGARFAGAWAAGPEWRVALIARDHATHVLACLPRDGRVPTILDLVPAADWDEREAHDLYGHVFEGHEPQRALVAHPHDQDAWTTPVAGDGVHEVAVGPIHAGVIESGHFRFHVVGERILALDPPAVLQAPRARAGGPRAAASTRASPTHAARARPAR